MLLCVESTHPINQLMRIVIWIKERNESFQDIVFILISNHRAEIEKCSRSFSRVFIDKKNFMKDIFRDCWYVFIILHHKRIQMCPLIEVEYLRFYCQEKWCDIRLVFNKNRPIKSTYQLQSEYLRIYGRTVPFFCPRQISQQVCVDLFWHKSTSNVKMDLFFLFELSRFLQFYWS